MEESAFSAAFCEFIRTCVPSLQAAAVLACMARNPRQGWDPPAILSELRSSISIDRPEIERCIEFFESRGLIRRASNGLVSLMLDDHVRTLAQAYEERPVTLVQLIYALRDDRIRSFADAFRFRKD
jgi:hypothetical protein